ncbi:MULTISPECIES: DUF7344 domain-containing protein [Halomicrobium]|uniref:DUF7344 domain-containing protein n=2 Tax=Halomicrobium mukohataei TaxID=57705 RepID=C7NW12_HALMD|nr:MULTISPECIES: hypothetical protein [Halomicrobium]ACV48141.1 conserved hypothetical protein [Halomicrobium mukohataei DSM 12286]QCD66566.1 hypothetical protein E5139_13265 [Halomicrobium mukohataei]QFR21372.1 hypothetical protein GBQ70_13280 [Halomicrobium sp. ZPS1]
MSATRDESTQTEGGSVGDTNETTESAQQEGAEVTADEPAPLPVDRVFELLKNQRRREVLRYLEAADDETVSLSDLAEHIAAIENDTTVQAISSSERKRVYVGLYQCHLPKMDDMNVVAFDQNRGTISLGPNADQLEEFLDIGDDEDRPWPRYYAGLAAGGTALYGLALIVPAVSVGVVVPVVLVAFGCCAIVNEYVDRQTDEQSTV